VDPEAGRPKIRLFTSAGALLATVQWEQSCAVVAMSWTAKEQLVVVGEDGTVVLFSVHGEKLATFSALPAVSASGRAGDVRRGFALCFCAWCRSVLLDTAPGRSFSIRSASVRCPLSHASLPSRPVLSP
jgi:hypothetical protein